MPVLSCAFQTTPHASSAWCNSAFGSSPLLKGGRYRRKIEKDGFNRQKNSGLNLEHVYSIDPEKWKAYYLLLPIASILVQLLERGSLLRRRAAEAGRPVWKLFGSLRNLARRLLDSVRYLEWEANWFDPEQAAKQRIDINRS